MTTSKQDDAGSQPGEVRSSAPLGLAAGALDLTPDQMRALLSQLAGELKDARALADSEGTRAVKYLRRARKAEAALRELVALKDLKEGPMERSIRASMSIGANPSEQHHQWNEEYQRRKPIAWQAAREVLGPNV